MVFKHQREGECVKREVRCTVSGRILAETAPYTAGGGRFFILNYHESHLCFFTMIFKDKIIK